MYCTVIDVIVLLWPTPISILLIMFVVTTTLLPIALMQPLSPHRSLTVTTVAITFPLRCRRHHLCPCIVTSPRPRRLETPWQDRRASQPTAVELKWRDEDRDVVFGVQNMKCRSMALAPFLGPFNWQLHSMLTGIIAVGWRKLWGCKIRSLVSIIGDLSKALRFWILYYRNSGTGWISNVLPRSWAITLGTYSNQPAVTPPQQNQGEEVTCIQNC